MKYKVKISNFTFGVPQPFLAYEYNPEQFELIGLGFGDLAKEAGITVNPRGRSDLYYLGKNNKPIVLFARVLIKFK